MRIAIIEDNETLASAIAYRLRDRGHATDLIYDGSEADLFLKQEGADLVILDINLPGMDGLNILNNLRQRGDSVPVILLTARSDTKDRIAGLDMGADDYLIKPFEMDELEARVRALSRRKNLKFISREKIGTISFDRNTRQVSVDDHLIEMPKKEVAILECLLDNRARITSKAQLTDHIYGIGADVDETLIEPHVSRLRRRLVDHGVRIKSARGLGYLLETDT